MSLVYTGAPPLRRRRVYEAWDRDAKVPMPTVTLREANRGCNGYEACVQRVAPFSLTVIVTKLLGRIRADAGIFYHEVGHVLHQQRPELQAKFVALDPASDTFNARAAERFGDAFAGCALGDLDYRKTPAARDSRWADEPLSVRHAVRTLFRS